MAPINGCVDSRVFAVSRIKVLDLVPANDEELVSIRDTYAY